MPCLDSLSLEVPKTFAELMEGRLGFNENTMFELTT